MKKPGRFAQAVETILEVATVEERGKVRPRLAISLEGRERLRAALDLAFYENREAIRKATRERKRREEATKPLRAKEAPDLFDPPHEAEPPALEHKPNGKPSDEEVAALVATLDDDARRVLARLLGFEGRPA